MTAERPTNGHAPGTFEPIYGRWVTTGAVRRWAPRALSAIADSGVAYGVSELVLGVNA